MKNEKDFIRKFKRWPSKAEIKHHGLMIYGYDKQTLLEKDILEHWDEYTEDEIKKVFGSIVQFCNALGISKAEYKQRELLEGLIRFYDKYGKLPVAADCGESKLLRSANTYRNNFGSWSTAIKRVKDEISIR